MGSKVNIGCPRCKGELYIFNDLYGQYEQCLDCGYSKDLKKTEVLLYSTDVNRGYRI